MRKLLAALLCFSAPVFAQQPDVKYKTHDALGCVIVKECTEDVHKITSVDQLSEIIKDPKFITVKDEVALLLEVINELGIEVYIASGKYFPYGIQGIYHTRYNLMLLNNYYMQKPKWLLGTIRHEGWHLAQDCMAGTLDNSLVAVIMNAEKIPEIHKYLAKRTYAENPRSIPWEQEAKWAEATENMTVDALKACSAGEMWKVYEPTPLTKEFLVKEGYIND